MSGPAFPAAACNVSTQSDWVYSILRSAPSDRAKASLSAVLAPAIIVFAPARFESCTRIDPIPRAVVPISTILHLHRRPSGDMI